MSVLRRAVGFLLALVLMAQMAHAQSTEYKLKAAYLCRLVDFIEWSADTFPTPDSPVIIGVLGADPFGSALDDVAEGQASGAHPFQIRRFANVNDIDHCNVLFISESEAPRLPAILHALEGRKILTVSDIGNFTAHGGMIRFFTENKKVRFRINLEAARACKLSISSRLLQMPGVVNEGAATP